MESLKEIERFINDYHNKIKIKELLSKELSNKPKVGFIEGPPTMNGEPHIGHIRGRIIKDLWYRYKVLNKYNVIFRAGWDTQGLPVELQAEKELGLSGSKLENLKAIGMEKFVQVCKDIVKKYNKRWVEVDNILGISFDHENAYWTYHDKYIEREWQYLKKAWENGILVEDYAVVAYCPSCQTSLSHAEVNQGYETVEDPSLYYKVKLVDEEAFAIVWTTMPFTLITDEMIGVNPNAEYLYIKVNNEVWIVGKDRLEDLKRELRIEYSIIKSINGKELEGKRYIHPLIDLIPGLQKFNNIHIIVAEDFVDTSTGSGIVHLSPANGEEDFIIAKKRGLPIFNPIDDQVRFTEDAGMFAGMFVRDTDMHIVDKLRSKGALVKIGKIRHEYPLCWRSKHKLVWVARREYFNMVNKIGNLSLKAAENVEYYYPEPKNRFLSIITEQKPWCISRERIWGTPLPIWVCSNCKYKNALFSREEIIKNAKVLPDSHNFELHRPWIDRIIIKCKRCNGDAYREPFVLDTWHNSGAAPYSSLSDDEFNTLIPVEFLTEGIDQTRGWAYTLLIESVIMYNKAQAPFRSFLFQGHVLDEKGNKMSKSLGNVIDGYDLVSKYPVDLIRLYFTWKASPIDPLSFSIEEMQKRTYQILNTLYNLHIYFMQNSSYDNFNENYTISWAISNKLLDVNEYWLLSKLENLKIKVTYAYDHCRYHEAARALENFIINDLSQTYIPLIRNELWSDDYESKNRRLAIYSVLAYALLTIDILLHPISPFITEYLAVKIFNRKSILLEEWPKVRQEFINNNLEHVFEIINKIISIANAARNKASLKRRWPLSNAYIALNTQDAEMIRSYIKLLNTQMNVLDTKIIGLSNNIIENIIIMLDNMLPIKVELSLKRSSLAPKVKADLKKVLDAFNNINHIELLKELRDGKFLLAYDNKEVEISKEDLEIKYDAKEGYTLVERDNIFVFLTIARDDTLIKKGLVRDLARRLQALRKELAYNPTEILNRAYIANLDNDTIKSLNEFLDELAYLVRVKQVMLYNEPKEGIKWYENELDGKTILLSIEK